MTSGSQEPPPGNGDRFGTDQPWYGDLGPARAQPSYAQATYGPQPPYGQHQYVPPPGGYAPPPAAATPYVPPRRRRGLGIVGLVLAVIGAAGVLLAFLHFSWYRRSANSPVFFHANRWKFSQLHQHLGQVQRQLSGTPAGRYVHFGVSPDYFGRLGWLLFAVSVALAVLAVLPISGASIARVLGMLVGLSGVGFTLWALYLVRVTGPVERQLGSRAPRYSDWISHSYVGAWLALGGFLLLAIAAASGPRRKAL